MSDQAANPEKLYMDNEKLVYYVLYRQFLRLAKDEDIQQAARLSLWRACLKYDPSAGTKFTTYAVAAIQRAILRELEIQNCPTKKAELISLYTPVGRSDGEKDELITILPGAPDIEWIDLKGAMSRLSKQGQHIISLCIAGYNKSEIGRMLGTTQQAVSCRLRRLRDEFKTYI